MKTQNLKLTLSFLAAALMLGVFAVTGTAQTSAFTYQGRFIDSTVAQPTNGTYNMQFALFDAVSGDWTTNYLWKTFFNFIKLA